MQHVITKFGGTSVSSRENWENIAIITQNHIQNGKQPIIVCSALSQASNKLEAAIDAAIHNEHHGIVQTLRQNYFDLATSLDVSASLLNESLKQLEQWLTGIALLKEAPARTRAQILSLGELMMTRLGEAFLQKQGIACLWFDAREALVTTPIAGGDRINYLAARCQEAPNPTLSQAFLNSGAKAIITQGFIAANQAKETVLLGRGGSDTSAALLAAILEADSCEIWTDVPGIYTANPHQLPHARLLKQLNYYEAQEIASMGAKVLHPNCLPPVRRANIPLFVKYTRKPEHCGTKISTETDAQAPNIKSIQIKSQVMLISIDTLDMWQQVGFLADVFTTFKSHGFSVDLLSSSEFNVTVSLDTNAKLRELSAIDALLKDLNHFGRAKLIEPCSAVSLVGHHIRTVLPELGPMLEVFEAQQVHLMSLASNDLNLTFVVAESQADKLCQKLHQLLIENNPQHFYYSKTWHEEFGQPNMVQKPWWETEKNALLSLAQQEAPCYVYHAKTIEKQAESLAHLTAIDQIFYAIKANPHPDILKILYEQQIGFECVSIQELKHVQALFPKLAKSRLLFTPNFAAKEEYEYAFSIGCHVTIDNLHPLQHWPEIFQNQSILIRLDPGCGAGHHKYVCTGGNESKFGIASENIQDLISMTHALNIKVIGLHAHSGSGILTPELWAQTALFLAEQTTKFPNIQIINLGGGLGIVEKPGQQPLNLEALQTAIQSVKSQFPNIQFWLEPGRFFVAESGVLLARVTQCKEKGNTRFIGIETGMNSLIRPMLYGAYHEIVNLSKLSAEKTSIAHIVGPICESGDTLGYDRLMPPTKEGDVLLIATAGAYGHCMSSNYNLRPAAKEVMMSSSFS